MRVVYEYSHLGGAEILQVRYPELNNEIREIISGVEAVRDKVSREKPKAGQMLYGPRTMNAQFRDAFRARGYSELRDTYTITIPNSAIAIVGAFKQDRFREGECAG